MASEVGGKSVASEVVEHDAPGEGDAHAGPGAQDRRKDAGGGEPDLGGLDNALARDRMIRNHLLLQRRLQDVAREWRPMVGAGTR